jgi:hypothetical protein
MSAYLGLLVIVVALATGLAYAGISTVRTSRAGRVISTISDPKAVGFEALVEPTPTLVLLDEADDGSLSSAAVLSLNANDQGGAAFLIPPATLTGTDPAAFTLGAVYKLADPEATRLSAQDILTLGISEQAVVDPSRWAELLAPVGPLTIDNHRAVEGFPVGPVTVQPGDVRRWLDPASGGGTQLDRLDRFRLLLKAWVAAVGASPDPEVVPGEVDSGLGRFVRGLAHGPVRIEDAPVILQDRPDGREVYLPDLTGARAAVNQTVPFPSGSPSQPRVHVRLLDGTGDQTHVARVAPMLIPADAEIVVAGNADRFDYTTSEVRYHDPLVKEQAEALQNALGAGTVVEDPRPTEAFDVTIVLGTDV